MLDGKNRYACEKFRQAVHTLATGAGDVRSRLLHAWQGPLWVLKVEDLPEDLRKDFLWIKEQLLEFPEEWPGQLMELKQMEKRDPTFKGKYAHLYPNSVEASLRRIRENTGIEIANRIYSIYASLELRSR